MDDDKSISYFPPQKADLNDWDISVINKAKSFKDHSVFLYNENGHLIGVNYKKFAYYSNLILADKMVDEKRLKDAAELLHKVKPTLVNAERKKQ